ncbi:MAG TPA: HRDC domain-containing protein [Candidatus Kapabacteria bacterium]|nr:HRDC domain-containing protein [Candidatus Kapabacteria bacterium]HPO61466.1 HRDC domain-containing protein [Candidatus Kapabacteria bacterium]
MKVKVFHIRLTKENFLTDQDSINQFLESVTVIKTSTQFINGQINFWSILVFYDEQKIGKQYDKISVSSYEELTSDEKRVYDVLKHWRFEKASELNLPRFMVCHNTELMTVAKIKPQTLDELKKIKGFGKNKIAKLGGEILNVLNSSSDIQTP